MDIGVWWAIVHRTKRVSYNLVTKPPPPSPKTSVLTWKEKLEDRGNTRNTSIRTKKSGDRATSQGMAKMPATPEALRQIWNKFFPRVSRKDQPCIFWFQNSRLLNCKKITLLY